ncbi:prolyl oligopeptidase family serine peptidase [Nesterenkonia natronophila]|uniref:S9 family peptidase n=1 Tax=Nesterenkonia natronophila TaxID=2174932 RepID=A0A3A4FKE6_9MICC|nr:prolyl oligopeptidase family serine peptidase [Nesterenkonia natronophila]RJN32875.1 S9 family peptidase [Nesterenkonia natronophila]
MMPHVSNPDSDSFQWLEDVEGEDALAWVEQRNRQAEAQLQDEHYDPLRDALREILDASDRIPGVTARGEWLYNFWTDAEHPQGLWRRTTLESYKSDAPDWEILLDLDALSEAEGTTWVWHGASVLRPEQSSDDVPGYSRALIDLSPGGSDADVTREFDLHTRRFVDPEEGGFYRPQGKGGLGWIDADTVYASTDRAGPQEDTPVTSSGYPRVARRWARGTELEDAEPIISVAEDDMVASAGYDSTPGFERHVATRMLGFYDSETYLIEYHDEGRRRGGGAEDSAGSLGSEPEATLTLIDVPTDLRIGFHRDLIFFAPRTEATVRGVVLPAGSLYVADAAEFLHSHVHEDGAGLLTPLFTPTDSTSLQGITATRNLFALTVMEDVVEHVQAHWRDDAGTWQSRRVLSAITGSLSVAAYDARENDDVWITAQDFLTPTTRYLGSLAPLLEGNTETYELIKQAPERFNAEGLAAVQSFATSADGTRVPYFLIGPAETVQFAADGAPRESIAGPEPQPTVLYGYGGFEISQKPSYLPLVGKAWLERGGVFAVANIRGGGEYGPRWHQAALKENRGRAFEDFAAVARELVSTGVTTTEQLACRGGSNGGLLTGNMLTQHPDLFGAVVIQVPLLDMKRYSHLLAGASWRAEYGDPDTADWEHLQAFSPYHQLDKEADYPPVLLTTSTKDDRVHPGHARKMTAALESVSADVTYWENTQGGHGGAANPEQQATMNALIYRFLSQRLGLD